jgi:biopolymer transport protein TolQ
MVRGFVGAALGGRLADVDTLGLVLQASWVVQAVLLLLALLSVISWTIIAFKWRELRRARQDSEAFLEVYQEGSLDAAYDAARDLDRSPLAAIFLTAYGEMNRMARFSGKRSAAGLGTPQLQALERHVRWASAREGQRLERGLSFLATTGSAAPFIGLFGTVIGIINAFQGIGRAGSASLAVVAPGIAEALIATAVGLFAAIPATVFFNQFLARVRVLASSIDLFAAEYQGDLRRLVGAHEEPPRVAQR